MPFLHLIAKDALCEWRGRRAWPTMGLVGIVCAAAFAAQNELLPAETLRLGASQLWVAVFFAAGLMFDRAFAAEREEGCWHALLLYPVSAAAIYLAKVAVQAAWLMLLQAILIPVLVVLYEAPLLHQPAAMLLVALLGSVGIAAVGVLLSAAVAAARRGTSLTILLSLPLAIPVLLAATEATRLACQGELGSEWWRCVGLLATFALVFVTAGALLIDVLVEE